MIQQREIKFRAWLKDKGTGEHKMFYQNEQYLQSFLRRCVFFSSEKEHEKYGDYQLLQFTGLHDKNRAELYEGDIYEETRINLVSGNTYKSKIVADYKTLEIYKGDVMSDLVEWEIIGNVFQNPELIEE